MQRYRPAYPSEFRRQMVDLVHSGRTPEELSEEFEPTAQSLAKWVRQADRDAGKRVDGTTSAEREGLSKLRSENRRLRQECDILAKHVPDMIRGRQPGSRGRARPTRTGLAVHERAPGHLSHPHDGTRPEGLWIRLLCLAQTASIGSGRGGCRLDPADPHDPCAIPWHLWRPPHPRRTACRRCGCWPGARGPVDAKRLSDRRQPPAERAENDVAASGSPVCKRPGAPELCCQKCQCTLALRRC